MSNRHILLTLLFAVLSMVDAWEGVPFTTVTQADSGIAGGEGGQVIFAMRIAPSNPDYLYLATDVSRVWASTDGGVSWKNKPNGYVTKGAVSLAIDPNNENIVLTAGSVHTTSYTTASMDGIYRTTDGGDHWTLVYATGFIRDYGQDNIVFVDSDTVYCGTHTAGLLKSTDGGLSWTPLNILDGQWIAQVAVCSGNTAKLFIGTINGLYTLENDTLLTPVGGGLPSADITAMAVSPTDSAMLYVISNGTVYQSVNSGDSFMLSNTGLPSASFKHLEISPVNPAFLYTSTEGQVWHSHNGGATWENTTRFDPEGYMADLNQANPTSAAYTAGAIIAPSYTEGQTVFSSGAGHYPAKSTDGGGIWHYSGSGFMGTRGALGSTSFLWDKNDPLRFAVCATDHGVFLTKNGGQTFINTHVPRTFGYKTSMVGAFYPVAGSKRIVATVGSWTTQQIIVSTDEGETWTLKDGTSGEKMHPFAAFHPQKPENVYVGKFFSADTGDTWTELSRIVYAMFPGNGDIVYSASIGDGYAMTLYKSLDKGQTWTTPYAVNTGYGSSRIQEMTVAPDDEDRIYVASEYHGVFIWDGVSWSSKGEAQGLLKDTFNRYSCQKVVVDPNEPNVVYVGKAVPHLGHSNGVFMSKDKGESWETITNELGPDFNLTALSVNPNDGALFLGSSSGNYKCYPKNETIQESVVTGPQTSTAQLWQTPNPFSSKVNIHFSLSLEFSLPIRIMIYDLSGRLVRTLYYKGLKTGMGGVIHWNGKDDRGHALSNGVYLVTTTIGSQRLVSTISLIR
jgi:photosystem II stability/assembly factor-like uncharacterized protein